LIEGVLFWGQKKYTIKKNSLSPTRERDGVRGIKKLFYRTNSEEFI